VSIGCENDADVVEGIRKAIEGDAIAQAPIGGVDFVWGRLRELEAKRGWWTRSKTDDNAQLRSNAMVASSSAGEEGEPEAHEPALYSAVSKTVGDIAAVFEALPPCTAFVVYSGTGDPRETYRLQALQQTFRREYAVKKWDQLSVKWTDKEEQALRKACYRAREGIAFVVVK
jgi:RNA exonuclease 1